jgi:hypothetical protein
MKSKVSAFCDHIISVILDNKDVSHKECVLFEEYLNNSPLKQKIIEYYKRGLTNPSKVNKYTWVYTKNLFSEKQLQKNNLVIDEKLVKKYSLHVFNELNLLNKKQTLFYYKYDLYENLMWSLKEVSHINKDQFELLLKKIGNVKTGLVFTEEILKRNPDFLKQIIDYKDDYLLRRKNKKQLNESRKIINNRFKEILSEVKTNMLIKSASEIKSLSKLRRELYHNKNLSNREKDIIDRYLHNKTKDGKKRSKSSRSIQKLWSIKDAPRRR